MRVHKHRRQPRSLPPGARRSLASTSLACLARACGDAGCRGIARRENGTRGSYHTLGSTQCVRRVHAAGGAWCKGRWQVAGAKARPVAHDPIFYNRNFYDHYPRHCFGHRPATAHRPTLAPPPVDRQSTIVDRLTVLVVVVLLSSYCGRRSHWGGGRRPFTSSSFPPSPILVLVLFILAGL